jgi:hypothetical protein
MGELHIPKNTLSALLNHFLFEQLSHLR